MTKKTNQQSTAEIECKHKTYQGIRAPKVDCEPCWKKYFSTDTENKKKKYPNEYEKYMVIAVKKPERVITKITTIENIIEEEIKPKSLEEEMHLRTNTQGEQVADIPIRLNRYFWSETLQATVKLVGFSDDLLLILVDQRMLVPRIKAEELRLIPFNADYFVYGGNKRIPKDAAGKTMTVFPQPVAGESPVGIKPEAFHTKWPNNDVTWPADAKLEVEAMENHKHGKHKKRAKKPESDLQS